MWSILYQFLILLTLSLIFSCQQSPSPPIESGVSKTLADHRKATIKNVVYDLEFTIPAAIDSAIFGLAVIEFDLCKLED